MHHRPLDRKNQEFRLGGGSVWRGQGRIAAHPALELPPNSPIAQQRRREFIDLKTLMLVRALAGPRACRKRKLLFTQAKGGGV
jgi:hypothetical protein